VPESIQHAHLVQRIIDWVMERHGADPGLCVFRDTADAPLGTKPRAISGYVPDVLARTVPASFVLVGEAKWYGDLDTRRSQAQLRAFLEYLALQPEPKLVLATPWGLAGTARLTVRHAAKAVRAGHVSVEFLHF
jgi:hypothetical protein